MDIRTKPITKEYVENYDRIFKGDKNDNKMCKVHGKVRQEGLCSGITNIHRIPANATSRSKRHVKEK